MSYQRLAYDDAATTSEMRTDAAAVGRELHLPTRDEDLLGEHLLERDPLVTTPFGTPVVSAGLAELAAGLELHFD